MKIKIKILGATALFMLLLAVSAMGQVGSPFIHDPSTIMEDNGKYYTFGTGGGGLISEDGWTWNSGAVRPGGGAAPDAIKIGDRYLIVYGATGGGLGGRHNGRILTMWNKTLDPNSPDLNLRKLSKLLHPMEMRIVMQSTRGFFWIQRQEDYGVHTELILVLFAL